jgi:hypothetical protein
VRWFSAEAIEHALSFHCALARQCFIEYVFTHTPRRDRAHRLRKACLAFAGDSTSGAPISAR